MVNFTREPIIESVITPREGCKLVVRNSKGTGLEEYFVDALEVVSFGPAVFYRSLERPKNFLLPVSDYEVLEVRETRMVLKHMLEPEKRGRDDESSAPKERRRERRRGRRRGQRDIDQDDFPLGLDEEARPEGESVAEEALPKEAPPKKAPAKRAPRAKAPPAKAAPEKASPEKTSPKRMELPGEAFANMPPPPTALISETIGRYKEMLTSAEQEEPQLVPPSDETVTSEEAPVEAPKGASLFSPASFLKKLTGREEEQ